MAALNGMGEISQYYGFSSPTILALIRHRNFPAIKLTGGTWSADTQLIDNWRKNQILKECKETPGQKDLHNGRP